MTNAPRLLLSMLILALVADSGLALQRQSETESIEWARSSEVDAVLRSVVSVDWKERDLRSGLDSFQTTFKIPIIGDRRIDPHLRITARIVDQPLELAIAQAVEPHGFEAVAATWGLFVAPPTIADRSLTTAALLRGVLDSLPANERRRLTRATTASWPRLAQPRELLGAIGEDYQVQISGLDKVPHDVWDSRELPELDLIDRLTIVLSNFDLTVRWIEAGKSLEIVPLPERVRLTQTYTIPANRRAQSAELESLFPGGAISVSGARVEVDGLWHVHRAVQVWLAGESVSSRNSNRPMTGNESLLTLNAESAKLSDVVALLEERLELTFEWSEAASAKREERVPLRVTDVTLEQLLDKITAAAGLRYEREGKTIHLDIEP